MGLLNEKMMMNHSIIEKMAHQHPAATSSIWDLIQCRHNAARMYLITNDDVVKKECINIINHCTQHMRLALNIFDVIHIKTTQHEQH
jgi:hypothetical protein